MNPISTLATFRGDLRHALRALAKSPGYTAVAVLTLTLGIGGVSAIFSVVDAVLLQPLPYAEPERLVRIAHAHDEDGPVPGHFSPPDFDDLQAATRGIYAPLAAYFFTPGHSGINLTGDGEPQRLEAAFVSSGFFPALGVSTARGRALAAGENVPGRDRVAVISDGLWRRRFSADPRLVGRAVTLDGEPFTVVGVMPPAFRFPSREVDVWIPISLIGEDDIPRLRGLRWMSVFGRLAPGVTEEEARAATGAVLARLATENPETNERWRTAAVTGLKEALVADVERALLVLFGAVALVLAIACVNLANLSLARATSRRREVAIRAALGAGRGRLLAGSLAESVLLALGGGALALLAASWGIEALVALAGDQLPRPDEVGLDLRVAAFTFLVAAATGFAFGLAPALRAARQDPHLALQEGGRSGAAGRRHGLRGALVVAETALAVVLAAGAGLAIKSLDRLLDTDPGFRPENVLALSIAMPDSERLGPEERHAYRERILARIAELPGVVAVGGAKTMPLHGGGEPYEFTVPGRVGEDAVVRADSGVIIVTPGYFRALGIPVLAGREIGPEDTAERPGLVVSDSLARRLWPGEEAVGKELRLGEFPIPVVGVVGDVRVDALAQAPGSTIYLPSTIAPRSTLKIFVRTRQEPLSAAAAVREAIWQVNRDQPIADVATLEQVVAEAAGRPRFLASLLGAFGALAVALAAIGVYGVVAYAVRQRTHEIGLRMALGAGRRQVLSGVVGRTAALVGAGLALGLAGALALTRTMAGLLYEVSATDPGTYLAVALLLAAVALLASWLPARRAAGIDPMVVLRSD